MEQSSLPHPPAPRLTATPEAQMPVLLVGGSAGAIESLTALLSGLAHPCPFPVVAVVHLPPHRPSLLPEVFSRRTALSAVEAEEKAPLEAGALYFAPPDYHLLIESDFTFGLSADEPVHFSRPSVDVLFESAAAALGSRAVGVLLSGANEDGAQGLWALQQVGAPVFIQDPQTATARQMPEAAARLCPSARLLAPRAIAVELAAALEERWVKP